MLEIENNDDFKKAYERTVGMMVEEGGVDDIKSMTETPITSAAWMKSLFTTYGNELPAMNEDSLYGMAFAINDCIIQLEDKIPPTFANWNEAVTICLA